MPPWAALSETRSVKAMAARSPIALGVLGGAVVGAGAAGTEKMVPYTLVAFRDNQTGQMYEAAIDGPWRPGMAIRYSPSPKRLVLR